MRINLMKLLKRVNKYLKEYQPTIQTIGIILLFVGIILALLQYSLGSKQIEEQALSTESLRIPKFEVNIENKKLNPQQEDIVIKSGNPFHSINKVTICLLNNEDLDEIDFYKIPISTFKLKNVLKNNRWIINTERSDDFAIDKSKLISYPLIFDFEYIENLKVYNVRLLYNYKFIAYYFSNGIKIKSEGLEFVQTLKEIENTKQRLVDYSIFESNTLAGTDYIRFLKWQQMLDSGSNKSIYDFVKLNLTLQENHIVICDENNESRTIKYYLPEYIYNDSLQTQKLKLFDQIFKEQDKYGSQILERLLETEEIGYGFCRMSYSGDFEKLADGAIIFDSITDLWTESNYSNLEYLADNYLNPPLN